jgi:hypothetical protein
MDGTAVVGKVKLSSGTASLKLSFAGSRAQKVGGGVGLAASRLG